MLTENVYRCVTCAGFDCVLASSVAGAKTRAAFENISVYIYMYI